MDERVLDKLNELISGGHAVCTDSRQVQPGSVFFALKGASFNGNHFAIEALEKGCIAAVVDEKLPTTDERIIETPNVLQTLQQLSLFHRLKYKIPILGITGTNGKTTTKELVYVVLSSTFQTLATRGNLNNHIGVPLTLLELRPIHEIAIIEMGANHIGEIAELSALALPDFGIITNIGKAHLAGFGNLENILKAKTELYKSVVSRNGQLFVNGDNDLLMKESGESSKITYGKKANNHCSGKIVGTDPYLSLSYRVNRSFGKAVTNISGRIDTRLVGAYNFENIMASITLGLFFGVSGEEIQKALESYIPSNSRSQLIDTGHNTIFLDAYNANPTSMKAAIEDFSNFGKAPQAVLLGDMLEMGEQSQQEHQEIVRLLLEKQFKLIILVGAEFKRNANPSDELLVFDNVDQALQWFSNNPLRGYHILVKGSRGMEMEKALEAL